MIAIVQARMSSSRLPGKALADVAGRPLLDYVVQRVQRARSISGLIIATSTENSDDPIEGYAARRGLQLVRGSLHDVAGRFAGVVRQERLNAFVRICADSPYMDPAVIDLVVGAFELGGVQIATNVFPRMFPRGQSVEVFDAAAYLRGYSQMSAKEDKEHVSPFFYRSPGAFVLRNVTHSFGDYSQRSLCVDLPDDLARFRRFIGTIARSFDDYHWMDVLASPEFTTPTPEQST